MNSAEEILFDEARGYDRLGQVMGTRGDMSIFRRFGALSAETLLRKQAELQVLEKDLRQQQENDRRSGHPDRRVYHRSWWRLHVSGDPQEREGNDPRQLEILTEIEDKLTQYHEALLRHQKIMNLANPTKKNVESLVDWMDRIDRGNICLTGEDRRIWRNPDKADLAIVVPDDFFNSSITSFLIFWYHRLIDRHIHKEAAAADLINTVEYDPDRVFAVIKTLCSLVACGLLTVGITVLYLISDMRLRLGVTAIFTVFFALTLTTATDAKIKDIFGATAAFVAVLVVFIGTNDNTTKSVTG